MNRILKSAWKASLVALAFGAGAGVSAATIPLSGGAAGIDGVTLLPPRGMSAELARTEKADGVAAAAVLTFSKTGEERRFLALHVAPRGELGAMQAAALRYKLLLDSGVTARFAFLVYESSGGAWFKMGGMLTPLSAFTDGRMSLASFREAAFSADDNGKLDWSGSSRTWFGLVIDGKGAGTLALSRAVLTDESYRPTSPFALMSSLGPGSWSVSKEQAVKAEVTTPAEGQGGKPCMKMAFTFSGGGHQWAVPSRSVPELELSAYRALRLTYKASLPAGLNGLLVTLGEQGGGSYMPPQAPKASADWTTFTVPFSELTRASWTKDANGKLDLDSVGSISIGAHGTASGSGGDGFILVSEIEFLP